MRLTEFQINRYGPLRNFSHQCEDNLEVFFGPNESGKTLLLESVLKLLSPEIETVFPDVNRVREDPSGYLYFETSNGRQQLGDGRHLEDISAITPTQLRNVFVVRDSDLDLRDEHTFYDSVTQRIGDLHTNEIEAIQTRLVETGRLTSLDGRGLSRASGKDDAKTVRDEAIALKADISRYIEEAETDAIAGKERELLSVKAELRRCEEELAVQRDAEALSRHSTLSDRLEQYRSAVESIDATFTRETLDELRDREREAERAEREIERLTDRREQLREKADGLETELDELEAELGPMETRRDAVDEVERDLDQFRASHADAIGADRGMRIAKYGTLGGIGLGGIAATRGSTVAGVLLALIGLVSLGWYWIQHRSVRAAERDREAVLAQARDAGLEVASIDDVATAVRAFRDDLERRQERRDSLQKDLAVNQSRRDDVNDEVDRARTTKQEKREEIREILSEATVDDIAAYATAVAEQEELVSQQNSAEQSLIDTFGEPETTAPDGKIVYWEQELAELIEDVDTSITADDYDEARLAELEANETELSTKRDELEDELAAHEAQLAEFAERLQAIRAGPFLDESITLEAHTIEGLRAVVPELERLADQIDRDADVAREALDIFDGLKAAEEQKITDLFGEASRATEVFQRITGGRYTDVRYDPDEHVLTVQRNGGAFYSADQLSHGTKTQLYLAARVGLGEQLIGSDPGFFLMDDAFLSADSTRLREGFEVLQDLAAAGWQVLYFTAKDEVGKDLVSASDLACRELSQLA